MDNEKDFKKFIGILNITTSRINKEYFLLPTAGNEELIYRERVYCYELYHQLRKVFEKLKFPYSLGGEVDKRGHHIIYPKIGAVKPDIIVHVPGIMENNLVVIEVKPFKVATNEIKKDLDKLIGFLTEAKYYKAIHLVYGGSEEKIKEYVKKSFEKEKLEFVDSLFLFWHETPEKSARIYNWEKLIGPGS